MTLRILFLPALLMSSMLLSARGGHPQDPAVTSALAAVSRTQVELGRAEAALKAAKQAHRAQRDREAAQEAKGIPVERRTKG